MKSLAAAVARQIIHTARRRPMAAITGLIGALILLVWIAPSRKNRTSEPSFTLSTANIAGEADSSASTAGHAATTLALRNKLEQPMSLNFSKADFTGVLAWIGRQLDLPILYQTDAGLLDNVSIQAQDIPLRIILGEALYERNLAFLAQRDSIVIIPCEQSAHRADDFSPLTQFSAESDILLTVDEPTELFCGDRAQFRIRIVPQIAIPDPRRDTRDCLLHTAMYHDGRLIGLSTVRAPEDQWVEADFDGEDPYFLRLQPTLESANDLALSLVFDYGVPSLENP